MIGLLIYIATFSFIPIFIGYFAFFFADKNVKFDRKNINTNFIIILSIAVLSFLNKLLAIHKAIPAINLFPETSLMLLMYWISKSVTEKSLKAIVILTLIEVGVVILQYHLKINSFFSGLALDFKDSDLLYDNRPVGLSTNSSVIALKIFLSYILLIRYKLFNLKHSVIISLVLIIGVILTFNRTVIITLAITLVLYLYEKLKFSKLFYIATLAIVSLIISFYFDSIWYQLSRGREGADVLSGRPEIWLNFFKFIKDNLILGNNSYKFYVDFYGLRAHAHSSFIQILATHGIFISSLFLILILKNTNKQNYVYVVPILIYSLTQYGIFWGFSITDIVLYVLLFNNKCKINR